jgi:branched-chain amino acid transport system ATP-binding protein
LSHGEQRRLEIAVALASEPKLLLLDEPTAGLSVGEAADFINIIQHMAGGTTVIFCDHDMSTVFRLGDRIMVLYFGKMIAEGTPEEIKANSRVNEIYLGVREGKVDDTTAGIS